MSKKKGGMRATDRYMMPTAVNPTRKLSFPPIPAGRPSNDLRARWYAAIAQLIIRGVCDPREASELTGLKLTTMRKWYAEVLEAYRSDRTLLESFHGELWELRRESVDRVYRQVQDIAMGRAQETDSDKNRVELLKVVLSAAGHRSKLYGLDAPERAELHASVQTQSVVVNVTPESLETRFDLPAGSLADVGAAIAKKRSVSAELPGGGKEDD